MSPDVFARPIADACLSGWQVSQLAFGAANVQAQAHCETCTACATRVREESHEVAAAAYEAVPASLRKKKRSRARWAWFPAAAVASILCVALLRPSEDVRSKGAATSVHISVQRAGHLLFDDVPAEEARDLRSGDKLRLRVRAPRAKVEGYEDNAWAVYYDGDVPPDGWLPFGVALTDAGQTQLRVTLCNVGGDCDDARILTY